jgi:predicted nucleic acid-binding protein
MNSVLIDTSVLIGWESDRFDKAKLPPSVSVSVITVAELRLGVLMATSLEARARRMATLRLAEALAPLPVDDAAADAWAVLVASLRGAGRKAPINDSWIAATAIARGMPVATQDDDYDDMPGLEVIRLLREQVADRGGERGDAVQAVVSRGVLGGGVGDAGRVADEQHRGGHARVREDAGVVPRAGGQHGRAAEQ